MDAVLYPTDFDNSNPTILAAHLSKNCFRVQSNLPYQQLGKPDLIFLQLATTHQREG